jgi:TonB-dependent receptor
MNAINEQLRANSIENVVAAERIQELPDANAAETLGRLPGVSVLRSGGEGAKVVIRGLSPKYNKITLEGISMASADASIMMVGGGDFGAAYASGDRSSDISMISPYSLDGIEVFKAITADKDADFIGGSVNFKLREADPGLNYDLVAQMGYNHLKSTFNDYMITGSVSNRFFDDKIGVYLQGNIEQRNRSSNDMSAAYDVHNDAEIGIENPVYTQSFVLSNVIRYRQRYGATAVIDYRLDGGSVKFMNFFNQSNTTTDSYNDVNDIVGNAHNYSANRTETRIGSMSNILGYEQRFGKLKVEAKASHSYSMNYVPSTMNVNFVQWNTPLFPNPDSVNRPIPPTKVLDYRQLNDGANVLTRIKVASSKMEERQLEASLDLSYDFSLSDQINGFLKFGGKYRYKEKAYDIFDSWGADPIIGSGRGTIPILDAFPWMREELGLEPDEYYLLPFTFCDDEDFDHGNYLKSRYLTFPVVDLDLMEEILFVLQRDAYNAADNYPYVRTSELYDFSGDEHYYAGYVMTELNIGRSIKFIPGVRYEHNTTEYIAANGVTTLIFPERFYNHVDTSATRENWFLLPMIHLKYSPLDWFDIRLAYTKTLSLPSYQEFVPRQDVMDRWVTYNNKELVPETSQNYDLYLSFHHNKIGLLTAGGFIKRIDDQIFGTGNRIITDTAAYGFPSEYLSKWIVTTINNEYQAKIWGLEFDWQTNFWYLPGFLKGIVLNVNYTHIFSEAKYPFTTIEKVPGLPVWAPEYTNNDSFYVDQLIDQPDDIINVQIGYDYKGFSARLSMLYQSSIFKWPNFWPELNYHTASYLRWDLSVKQKLPWAGLEVFCNINNISSAQDRDLVSGANWDARIQEYGMTVDLGIRARLH